MATGNSVQITQLHSDVLSQASNAIQTVGQLEAALLHKFPASDACEWDKTGLLVGDRNARIYGVAVALDADIEAVRLAKKLGANVLLTHHPVYLDAPEGIYPSDTLHAGPSGVVWEAIRTGINLMNFHTALDVSPLAAQVLPRMLSLSYCNPLDRLNGDASKGFGQLCVPGEQENPLKLSTLAARCVAVFARLPRVWGNPQRQLAKIVTATGSASDLVDACLAQAVDCLVCGEIRYHRALDASQAGLCIIELGHDVSELPLCAILAQETVSLGIPEDAIRIIDQGSNWWTPEAVRR